jgi:TPR repeat protein
MSRTEADQLRTDFLDPRLTDAFDSFRSGNFATALGKLKRLEEQGHRSAPLYIANMLEKGYPGVPRDVPEAIQRYESLARQRNAAAIAALAGLYFRGAHVSRDYRRAFDLYSALAESGDSRSQFMLGDMYIRGLGVERDEDRARSWFEAAAAGGNVNALRNAAVLRILRGNWRGFFLLGKAIALTIYLKLFDRDSERISRV